MPRISLSIVGENNGSARFRLIASDNDIDVEWSVRMGIVQYNKNDGDMRRANAASISHGSRAIRAVSR